MQKVREKIVSPGTSQVIQQVNDTTAPFPEDTAIHWLMEAQVRKTPSATAVIAPGGELSYDRLNRKANCLAHYLRTLGVGPGTLVALSVERSLEMSIGIFGILKAGGAYLPIEPTGPSKRLRLMLADSAAPVLLTQSKYADKLSPHVPDNVAVVRLDDSSLYDGKEDSDPEPVNRPDDPAYVIYTSGSTGVPKGVVIEHRSLVNRLHWMQKQYPLTPAHRILQKTPFVFDVSVWELFWWSMVGASVCYIQPGFEKFPQAIIQTVETHKITTMHFVPSMMSVFLDYVSNSPQEVERLASLKQVFCSGEALKPAHVDQFNRTLHHRNQTGLINLYGPTEATVDVTYYDCPIGDGSGLVPIGKPIDNIQLTVVDGDGLPCPVGQEGELWISGVGVARGYLNRPELTAERFFSETYRSYRTNMSQSRKTYKTGDLARWLPDGNVEFLGRIDHQVKIRGLRIELGEIEAAIAAHPDISDCVVLVKQKTETIINLIACIISESEIPPVQMKAFLKQSLPDYMVPSEYIRFDSFPTTVSGKADRKALLTRI